MQLLEAGRLLGLDRLHHRLHVLLVEGGGDPQPPAADLLLAEALVQQLVVHHREQVALRPAESVLRRLRRGPGEVARQPVGHRLVERAEVDHAVQHVAVALQGGGRGLLPLGGVEVARRVQHGREQRALRHVEVLDVDAVVRLRGGLDAVGAAAEVDGVEVALQDLLFGQLLLDLQRQDCFLRLARVALLAGQVGDLDVLLGDRGRALRGPAGQVVPRRPHDALHVHAGVVVEGAVLGRDDGVLQTLGDRRQRHLLPVLQLELAELGLAVGEVDERRLGLEVLVRVGDVDRLVGDDERQQAGGHQGDESDPGPDQQPLPQRPTRLARLPAGPAVRVVLPVVVPVVVPALVTVVSTVVVTVVGPGAAGARGLVVAAGHGRQCAD